MEMINQVGSQTTMNFENYQIDQLGLMNKYKYELRTQKNFKKKNYFKKHQQKVLA